MKDYLYLRDTARRWLSHGELSSAERAYLRARYWPVLFWDCK